MSLEISQDVYFDCVRRQLKFQAHDGVDLFKDVFYSYDKRRKGGNKKIIEKTKSTPELKNFARTVVGYGYHLVHKMNNGTIHYEQVTR